MPRFLSPDWIDEVGAAARSRTLAAAGDDVRLVVQQVVTGTPDGEVRYHVVVDGGRVDVQPGDAEAPDVTFTQDWQTAVAMSTAELPAQHAFASGKLRVDGDVQALVRHQAAFTDLDRAFDEVRARTTY